MCLAFNRRFDRCVLRLKHRTRIARRTLIFVKTTHRTRRQSTDGGKKKIRFHMSFASVSHTTNKFRNRTRCEWPNEIARLFSGRVLRVLFRRSGSPLILNTYAGNTPGVYQPRRWARAPQTNCDETKTGKRWRE